MREGLITRIAATPRRLAYRLAILAAALHRHRLRGLDVVAITGSCGKTTTKALLTGILSAQAPTISTPGSFNRTGYIARTLLSARSRHRYCIMEIGAQGPNSLDGPLRLAAPTVGIVTNIMNDHYSSFRGRQHCAEEKAKLIRCLPATGTAVLNADDPLVAAMGTLTQARCLTYGRSAEADVQAIDIQAAWPDPLHGTIRIEGRSIPFRTSLFGEHWVGSVLAAVAAAKALGLGPGSAVAALERIPPEPHRMEAMDGGEGVSFILDDMKAPLDGIPAFITFVAQARARRKIVVFGHLSDFAGSRSPKYRRVAREALAWAEMVIMVGEYAPYAMRGVPSELVAGRLFVFDHLVEVNGFLQSRLRAGDLVALKGSMKVDHMERLVMAKSEAVYCWQSHCGRTEDCRRCEYRWKRIMPPVEKSEGIHPC